MKTYTGSDTIELLRLTSSDAFESTEHGKHPVLRAFLHIDQWFRRVVLLSGAQYTEVHRQQALARDSVLRGWRFGALSSCLLVGVSLYFNIVFTFYITQAHPSGQDGVGVFAGKTCDEVLATTTKIHVGINILATILVAASNYNMQCLAAPSRRDVDLAHQREKYLDIGVQSIHNLRYISKWKSVLWLALLFSTLPLHLLWNSAVFSIITSNRYAVLVVEYDFLNNDQMARLDCTNPDPERNATCWLLEAAKSGRGLEKLAPEDCIKRYSTRLDSDYSSVIAVAKSNNNIRSSTFPPINSTWPLLAYVDSVSYSSILESSCVDLCSDWRILWNCTSYCDSEEDVHGKPYNASKVTESCLRYAIGNSSSSINPKNLAGTSDWICETDYVYDQGCSVAAALRNSSNWEILPERYEIDHCLSSKGQLSCKLQYSSVILYVIITCNAVKFLAIALHLVLSREQKLATVGDALASFLENNDVFTKGKCLYTTNTSYSDQYASILH